jgi:hypothetical protein
MVVGFTPEGTPDSSTNKTDLHNIVEILLKVALNNTNLTSKTEDRKISLSLSLSLSISLSRLRGSCRSNE